VIPKYNIKVSIPQDLMGRITIELWSDMEHRVPLGDYSKFFERLVRAYFARERLDLALVLPGLQSGLHFITGESEALALLRRSHGKV